MRDHYVNMKLETVEVNIYFALARNRDPQEKSDSLNSIVRPFVGI